MKIAFGLTLIVFLMATMRPAQAQSEYCSADLINRDGVLQEQVRVDCESSYAGHCLQEVQENGAWNWAIVNTRICDALDRLQFQSAKK